MLSEIYPALGKPSFNFAVIALGSLARNEMSPYSDLEFAILVDNTSERSLHYIRRLVQWLELKVINLGETEIEVLDKGRLSPIKPGLNFDKGGNTPLDKHGY